MSKINTLKVLDNVLGKFLCRFLPESSGSWNGTVAKVLFIRPGGIGDAALLAPAISLLRKHYPEVRIDVLAEKRNAGVFALVPQVDGLFLYDTSAGIVSCLRRKYDIVIDTEQWYRLSAIVARLVRSKRKIGFGTNERARMFTDIVDYSHDDYETSSFYRLLQPLLPNEPEPLVDPFLKIPDSVKSASELLGRVDDPFVALFPGASIAERRWGATRFAELAEKVTALGFAVVVVGGAEDAASGVEIERLVPTVINLTGKTSLLETASLLNGAALLISGDSGVLHIAVGLGTRTVSLFGPGIVNKWAPRGTKHRVINLELPCSPCTKFGNTPPCPIDAKCVQDISVDLVFQNVLDLLPILNDGD